MFHRAAWDNDDWVGMSLLVYFGMASLAPTKRHPHSPGLSNVTLDRSIRVLGSPSSLDPLFRRLEAGLPITLGVLGA